MGWSHLDQSNWKSSERTVLGHVTLHFCRDVYVNAPSSHLPNKVHDVTCWKTVTFTVSLLSYLNPAHRAVTTNEFLMKHNIPSLPHPPYSPDRAPWDFLFSQLNKTMKGRRFDDVEEIQANVTRQMRVFTNSDYQRYFRQWQECCNKCIQAQGHYFEGDKTN